jgi:hypothetical protein
VKKTTGSENQMRAARKEIRANIRHELNTQELPLNLADGLSETMDSLLEDENHPINKLFALARLDKTKPDHWRVLTFIMVEEIFGLQSRGAPPKGCALIKNWELLSYLNEIHRMRIEDGYPSGVAEAILDLPTFFKVLAEDPNTEELAERYHKTKMASLKRYVHEALTEGAELLQSPPKDLNPTLAEIVERALDNFRPGWRQTRKQ